MTKNPKADAKRERAYAAFASLMDRLLSPKPKPSQDDDEVDEAEAQAEYDAMDGKAFIDALLADDDDAEDA